MGYLGKLIARVPIFFVLVGLVLATGTYRGTRGSFETDPLLGGGLAAFGVGLFVVFHVYDVGE